MIKTSKELLVRKEALGLDLAFTPASEELLIDLGNSFNHQILVESNSWQKCIRAWINVIKEEHRSLCPISVVNAKSISLGLEFTNDSTTDLTGRGFKISKKIIDFYRGGITVLLKSIKSKHI